MTIRCDDDEMASLPLGIGTVALYERAAKEGAKLPKKAPIGFVHFPDEKPAKRRRNP